MPLSKSLFLLFMAAVFEAGGDALVRSGMLAHSWKKAIWFGVAGLVLFGYGYLVNSPPWDFGKLLGAYVVLFFLVAQAIAWIFFHQKPGSAVMIGGVFILTGGIIIACSSLSN